MDVRPGIATGHVSAATTAKALRAPPSVGATKTITGAVSGTGSTVRLTIANHGLADGDLVWVQDVGGVTGGYGRFAVTVVDTHLVELQGSTFGGTYTSGGSLFRRILEPKRAPLGVEVYNAGAAAAYIGGPTVTADVTDDTAGMPVLAGATKWFAVTDPSYLFCRMASGAADLHFSY